MRSVNGLFFNATRLLLLPWMGDMGQPCVCVVTSRRLAKGADCQEVAGYDYAKMAQSHFQRKDVRRAALRLGFISVKCGSRIQKREWRREQLQSTVCHFKQLLCPVLIHYL